MLRFAGYECALPSKQLKNQLRELGCDTVLDVDDLVRSWGYERPMDLPEAGPADMARSDVIYVDVKAHRNGPKVWRRWLHLRSRTLWLRINGGQQEHVINERGDHGDEVNPPCPVLTPNQWYAEPGPWSEIAYAHWPPFHRLADYDPRKRPMFNRKGCQFAPPMCLVHNFAGWGYGALLPVAQKLGISIHGVGSPDGLINHREIPVRLSATLCMVHFKSNDAPGYALYEALASGCPVVCTRRLIWRCKMQELLIPGETCLVFDRETHEGLSVEDVVACERELRENLERLMDHEENKRIGMNGRKRLEEVMWREDRDGDGFRAWMKKCFP